MYCFVLILLAGLLVGCNSSNDNVDGTHTNELPREYFYYDTELVGEYVVHDEFTGTLDIKIRDVNNLIATLELVCDNTIDCNGVKQLKYSGTYSSLVFELKPEIGSDYTIDSIRDNFQKLDLKLRLIQKEKPEFTISFDTSIDVIDTMLMGGLLTLDKVQDGKLCGSVTGLINEFTQFNMSQQCQEEPTADCYTYHNAAVDYKVEFAFTLPND